MSSKRGAILLVRVVCWGLLFPACRLLPAQHCPPIYESYLSELSLRQKAGVIRLRAGLKVIGGRGQDAYQAWVLAFLERDAARVPPPPPGDLIDTQVALVLHTQLARRDAEGVFGIDLEISGDVLAGKMIAHRALGEGDREAFGGWGVYKDRIRLAIFIPFLDDESYSVIEGLPDDRHYCNYGHDRALLFQTLPYRISIHFGVVKATRVPDGEFRVEINGDRPDARVVSLDRRAPLRRLIIVADTESELELRRVGESRVLAWTDERVEVDLQADRYVVRAGGVEHPVPLLSGVVADGSHLVIRTLEPPETPAGFVHIPGGPTLIGDILGVGAVDERPARIEEVGAFLMAETETTNAQYLEFLNALNRCDESWIDLGGPKCGIRRLEDGSFATDAPEMPVVTVSHHGALAYCAWMTEKTGVGHRLPTEIEWERAARGPESTTYAYGDVYDPKAANQESGRLRATRSFPATGWGLFDLTGNAFEWTSSDYAPGLKVLKGGSYVLDGPYLRNSFRMWYRPLVQADDIGFRVIREVKE